MFFILRLGLHTCLCMRRSRQRRARATPDARRDKHRSRKYAAFNAATAAPVDVSLRSAEIVHTRAPQHIICCQRSNATGPWLTQSFDDGHCHRDLRLSVFAGTCLARGWLRMRHHARVGDICRRIGPVDGRAAQDRQRPAAGPLKWSVWGSSGPNCFSYRCGAHRVALGRTRGGGCGGAR